MKAYLTSQKIRFPKTHDLVGLQNIASESDGTFELLIDVLNSLSRYAVRFRYPGEEADRKEAMIAVKGMEDVRKFVRGKL